MPNLTTVGVTSGVPTSGTGTVSTLDNLIGTAGTGSSNVLTVQGSPSGTAVPVSLASVTVDNAGTFAVQQTSQGYSASVSITRPNDTSAYAANDVIGTATGSTAGQTFSSMGPSAGRIMITSASLQVDASAVISGETSYRLYLYNVTPPSATGDNGAWDLPSGDRSSFLGYIDLGTPVDLGSTLYVETNFINKQVLLAGTSLFGYLVTNGAYTPTANRVYKITLHAVSV